MSRKTKTTIYIDDTSSKMREDCGYTPSEKQPWVNMLDLESGSILYDAYATGEPGRIKLDGSVRLWPNSPGVEHLGYMSLSMSDGAGAFSNPPVIDMYPDRPINSNGLSITFGDTIATDVIITWYKENDIIVGTYHVTGNTERVCYIDKPTDNVEHIKLEFHATDQPYRYIKILSLDLGYRELFEKSLVTASALEEFDPMSNTITVNTLDFTVLNEDQRFNALSNSARLKVGQPVICELEISDDGTSSRQQMGKYYLQSWESTSAPTAKISAQDAIGLFDSIPYNHGLYYDPEMGYSTAGTYFQHVFGSVNYTNYTISLDVSSTSLAGYVLAGTVRDALQQICVASRAALRVKRDGSIEIYRPTWVPSFSVGNDVRIGNEKVTQSTISGITAQWYAFTESTMRAHMPADIDITASKGYAKLDLTNAQFFNYETKDGATVRTYVNKPARYRVTEAYLGYFDTNNEYVDIPLTKSYMDVHALDSCTISYNVASPPLPDKQYVWMFLGNQIDTIESQETIGENSNNMISGNTLITSNTRAQQIAQYWYDYRTLRPLSVEYKAIYSHDLLPGAIGHLTTSIGTDQYHMITSMETDLTGGAISSVKGVG